MQSTIKTATIFFTALATSFAMLFAFNLVPTELKRNEGNKQGQATATTSNDSILAGTWITEVDKTAEPVQIIIPKIGVDSKISNPVSTEAEILDEALLKGAVHYPGSGSLKDISNVFIFGHSTNHEVVKNRAYQTFNRLNELNIGDKISVRSNEAEYIYTVKSVAKAQASESLVTFSNTKRMLTLSTCDSFGEKSERFVVEAEFIKSVKL